MVIGDPMVGKTQALRLIEETTNKLAQEEFQLKEKLFLQRKASAADRDGLSGDGEGDPVR
jgi:hypothetical protein